MTAGEGLLKTHFTDAYRQVTQKADSPEIHISFHPVAGLNHTIHLRKQRIYVRLSEIVRDAPPQVHRALAFILVSKLFKKRAGSEHYDLYRRYTYHPEVQRASDLAKQQRERKQVGSAVGRVYNLNQLFARLNRRYFNNELRVPRLSWSPRKTKRIGGHHDYVHDTIVINSSLDSTEVPEFLIEFVLYHEMLHIKHPPKVVNGRRLMHTHAFRADERRYDYYEAAMAEVERWPNRK